MWALGRANLTSGLEVLLQQMAFIILTGRHYFILGIV